MITLTYGLKKPVSPDKGNVFYPALEDNFTQLDAHTHDGLTSAPVSSVASTKTTQSILAVNWSAVSGHTGTYRQEVTLPGTLLLAGIMPRFELAVLGHLIYPTIEKTASNKYYIYFNDNTLDIKATYA